MKRVYMDHGATTPVREEVLQAMLPYFQKQFGNPSSVHSFGRENRIAVDEARQKVAEALGADDPEEILFTSGGTESDNLALRGVAAAYANKGRHIVTSAVEHHAVLDTAKAMEKEGYEVTFLPVDAQGLVYPDQVAEAVRDDTVLVSIMLGNNEVGTLMPVDEIARVVHEKGALFHTDAVQAVGNMPVNVKEIGCDLLSLSAHKFYGPKGIGALYLKKGTRLRRVTHGGAQERKLRPGTENVPGIVGLAAALEIAVERLPETVPYVARLRDRLIEGVLSKVPDSRLNGHPTKRLPGNANFSFEYIEGESLLLSLDQKGIAGSSGSACTSGSLDPSHVLLALGLCHQTAHGSLRLTLGPDNTEEEVDYVINAIPEVVERLRKMSALFQGQR